MVDGTNLWQLRADCLRSLGRHFSEGNAQPQVEPTAREDYRSPRCEVLEVTSRLELSDYIFFEDRETEHVS